MWVNLDAQYQETREEEEKRKTDGKWMKIYTWESKQKKQAKKKVKKNIIHNDPNHSLLDERERKIVKNEKTALLLDDKKKLGEW